MEENVDVESQQGTTNGDEVQATYFGSDVASFRDVRSKEGNASPLLDDEAIDVSCNNDGNVTQLSNIGVEGQIRTLDGEIAGDEFAGDAVNYQILLGKIDSLLDRLRLDA